MTLLNSRIIRLSAASLLTGLLIGIVGGLFQLLLIFADSLRNALVAWAHGRPYLGWTAPVALGLIGAALARLMVVGISPAAEGSGVQRVEAVFSGDTKPASFSIVPVKFFGGLIAMGSGLALGREGPTVQMGASLAVVVSRLLVGREDDERLVVAAGAGAGLGVAFNAPISASIFVFEELTSSFTPFLAVAALSAASVAVYLVRLILGNHFDFMVNESTLNSVYKLWPFLVLGLLLGLLGALYNWIIIRLLRFADDFTRLNSVQRAALIGATVGVVAWFAPMLVGGGDSLTQAALSGNMAIRTLAIIFLLRFVMGPWSYAAGAPGGLFAPMLMLGASFGALFGEVVNRFNPNLGVSTVACAVVGMGTLFAACVRSPLTGIMLTVEMTGRGDLTLGLLGASLMAILIAILLKSEPIYDSLKQRMLEQQALANRRKPEPSG